MLKTAISFLFKTTKVQCHVPFYMSVSERLISILSGLGYHEVGHILLLNLENWAVIYGLDRTRLPG
jgi:hypothetical protein